MTTSAVSALHEKVVAHIEAAYQALEMLEESDRFWRSQLRNLENRQIKSLGLTKGDFDRLYHTAMSALQIGQHEKPPSLRLLKALPSTSAKIMNMEPQRPRTTEAPASGSALSNSRPTTPFSVLWHSSTLKLRPASTG